MDSPRIIELIRQIRTQCLQKGQGGIKQLGVIFRAMDSDFSKKLCFEEFRKGVKMFGLNVTEEDLKLLFRAFDKDNNKQIDFAELVAKLRPPMPTSRRNVINEAFNALDVIKDDEIKMEDLKSKIFFFSGILRAICNKVLTNEVRQFMYCFISYLFFITNV